MSAAVTLIPINSRDQLLIATMTRSSSPRWMRLAACLSLEKRRVVLVRAGLRVADACPACGEPVVAVRALHKNALGGDPRCIVHCGSCGHVTEDVDLLALERTHGSALKRFREAF